jgi:hypothetical protein
MFDAFTEDDDPWGEHDFGAFDHEGERIFWGDRLNDETLKISLRGRRRSRENNACPGVIAESSQNHTLRPVV